MKLKELLEVLSYNLYFRINVESDVIDHRQSLNKDSELLTNEVKDFEVVKVYYNMYDDVTIEIKGNKEKQKWKYLINYLKYMCMFLWHLSQ